jgi:hypothetical protein
VLIAEDVVLLLVDAGTGRFRTKRPLDPMLAGALLFELALLGRFDASDGKPVVLDVSETGGELLDEALRGVAGGAGVPDVLEKLAPGLRDRVVDGLVARKALSDEGATYGVFTTSRWQLGDPDRAEELRARLTEVLIEGEDPDERTAAVICLLSTVDSVPKVLDVPENPVLTMRTAHIAEDTWPAGSAPATVAAALLP